MALGLFGVSTGQRAEQWRFFALVTAFHSTTSHLWLGVCQGSGASGKSGQDSEERRLGTGGSSGFGFL